MEEKENVATKTSSLDNATLQAETLSIQDAETTFQTNFKTGLSSEEAKKRLEKYGPNKLQEKKKKTWIRIFFEQMANPMIYVLFAAILVTIGISIYETVLNGFDFFNVGDWPDVIIILAVRLARRYYYSCCYCNEFHYWYSSRS